MIFLVQNAQVVQAGLGNADGKTIVSAAIITALLGLFAFIWLTRY